MRGESDNPDNNNSYVFNSKNLFPIPEDSFLVWEKGVKISREDETEYHRV